MPQQNFNYENRFQISFDSEDYKDLAKNVVEITTPDISIGTTIQPTTIRNIYIPGNSIEFGDMQLSFLLDEDYANYSMMFQWLNKLRNFDSINLERDVIDINVVLLNGKYNPFLSMDFKDCFPYVMSEIPLSYQVSNLEPLRFSVTFKINGFIIR